MRAWIANGRLPARKSARGWLVRAADLPLTEAQRQRVQERAQQVRDVVDAALPSRAATARGHHARSLLDLDVFRLLGERIAALDADSARLLAAHDLRRAAQRSRAAALHLARALSSRIPDRRQQSLLAAQRDLAVAVALLHLAGAGPQQLAPFEQQILPMVGGLLRWSARRAERGRGR